MEESGFTDEEIADATGAPVETVQAWVKGGEQPTIGQARKLAKKLRRPLALLLWSSPPANEATGVAFRAPVADEVRPLNVIERRFIRQSLRIQKVVGHLDLAVVERPSS